jgi:hypothetical protein
MRGRTYIPSPPLAPRGEANRRAVEVHYSGSGTLGGRRARDRAESQRTHRALRRRVPTRSGQAGEGRGTRGPGSCPPCTWSPATSTPARRVFLVSPSWMSALRPRAPVRQMLPSPIASSCSTTPQPTIRRSPPSRVPMRPIIPSSHPQLLQPHAPSLRAQTAGEQGERATGCGEVVPDAKRSALDAQRTLARQLLAIRLRSSVACSRSRR